MAPAAAEGPPSDPRVYFAAERTLLAWIRTGLAMMGFGFVVARFGLFLRATEALHGVAATQQPGVSRWVGITLVALGVVANLCAAITYRRVLARLQRGESIGPAPSLGFAVAFLLALLGLLLGAYLVWGETTG